MKITMLALILAAGTATTLLIFAADAPPHWRVIIANDTCPDVTWGFQLAVEQGKASLNARGYGFSAIKLIR